MTPDRAVPLGTLLGVTVAVIVAWRRHGEGRA